MKSETTPPGKLTHLNPKVIYKWHMRCATVSLIDVGEVTLSCKSFERTIFLNIAL